MINRARNHFESLATASCALYSDAPNTMAKPVTKTAHGRDQRLKYAHTLAWTNKMAASCVSSFNANFVAL